MRIAFYKGKERFFNRFVSWWTRGPYSHAEAVFGFNLEKPMVCWSSSFMDGGVRRKEILLTPDHWDIIDVPAFSEGAMLDWFFQHNGQPYDVPGLLATSTPVRHRRRGWFCNEAIGAGGGVAEPWRFNPNSFARLCERLPGSLWIQGGPKHKPASAGFFTPGDKAA